MANAFYSAMSSCGDFARSQAEIQEMEYRRLVARRKQLAQSAQLAGQAYADEQVSRYADAQLGVVRMEEKLLTRDDYVAKKVETDDFEMFSKVAQGATRIEVGNEIAIEKPDKSWISRWVKRVKGRNSRLNQKVECRDKKGRPCKVKYDKKGNVIDER